MPRSLLTCFLTLLMGCAGTPSRRDAYRAASPAPPSVSGVVFVANGAGGGSSAAEALSQVMAETPAPLQIQTFAWSKGSRRVVLDQVDHDNHLVQGRRLAEAVTAYRKAYPERRICLLGQSAGGAVVLSAAELLPPDSIDRIVLLSPSVCTGHDLRLALRSAREGLDSFHSERDIWVLGLGVRTFGATDGECNVAAGKEGFRPIGNSPADAALYARLHQHPWNPSVQWTGHNGGHFGNLEPMYLRTYVLPLLVGR